MHDIPILGLLAHKEKAYVTWAEDYYEIEVDIESVAAIFEHQPLTTALIAQLNPDCCLTTLKDDLNEIGYPFEGL